LKLNPEERTKFYVRQGHAFVTADGARVVERSENMTRLHNVPWDGKTVGEIVTRGNIVMKHVRVYRSPVVPRKTLCLVFP
jgi:hypothetical protein